MRKPVPFQPKKKYESKKSEEDASINTSNSKPNLKPSVGMRKPTPVATKKKTDAK